MANVPPNVNNVDRSARLKCACGWACARRAGSSRQNKENFYLNCVNYELPGAKYCEVFVWERELDEYVNKRFASAVELAEYHRTRSEQYKADFIETVEELSEAQDENRKLKRKNQILHASLAATAPIAATVGVLAAWVAK